MSVRHALLGLLSEGPKYGLQLRQEFESRTGEVWPLNVGQVYTTLQRLERDGLVESDGTGDDERQKGFRITPAGEEELATWLRTPVELSSPPRDELVIKVLVALQVPGVEARDVIQAHRRYLVELMQQWTRIKEDEARVRPVSRPGRRRGAVPARLCHPVVGQRGRAVEAGLGRASRPGPRRHAKATSESRRAAMSFLEMRGVSKIYGEGPTQVKALSEVNLSVNEGALVAVMGPSGSGKSTLLTIAGSLEEPTSGEVVVGGAALSLMSRNEKARLRRRSVGYVFQDFNLLPGLTAAENVSLPLELDGLSARKAHSVGMAALEELGLDDRADHFPDQLSGGERQRVAIARAVVGDRRLLLADEPSGALDSVNGEAVMRMVLTACHRGLAAVVVTHDAQLASWADRVVFIRDGCVVDQTSPPPSPESLLQSTQP